METREFTRGSRKVIAVRNNEASKWHARLYVNNGETATLTSAKLKTTNGLDQWAKKILA